MRFGPILNRELLVNARRKRTYWTRAIVAAGLLIVLGIIWLAWSANGQPLDTTQRQSLFASRIFVSLIFFLFSLTVGVIPQMVARTIAVERERRTLSHVLCTPLTSVEIVLEKLAAGLCRYASYTAVVLPIMIVLILFGGVDPILVVLAFAGLISTAFAVGSLSIMISTGAETGRKAQGAAVALSVSWLVLPVFLTALGPLLARNLWRWFNPINEWLLASSPLGVLFGILRGATMTVFLEAYAWMIGLQVAAGIVFLVVAIFRLRPASRDLEGGETRILGRPRSRWHWRVWKKPACGDAPVLWKEMHTSLIDGFTKLLNVIACLALSAGLAYGLLYFGIPAFREAWANGYGSAGVDDRRTQFNWFVRAVTSLVTFVCMLVITGAAGESVAAERARDTWSSLIATPLSGREILRGKQWGAIWRCRAGFVILLVVWLTGIVAGAVHPLGAMLAAVVLAAWVWYLAIIGTFMSVLAKDAKQASGVTALLVMIPILSPLVLIMPLPVRSVLMTSLSAPVVECFALMPYDELNLLWSDPWHSPNAAGGFLVAGPAWHVAATCLIAFITPIIVAFVIDRKSLRSFDKAIGRPWRTSDAVRERTAQLEQPLAPADQELASPVGVSS
jgi:ABC-type transport system involved in multi-copper enzyme maturation permease subunit